GHTVSSASSVATAVLHLGVSLASISIGSAGCEPCFGSHYAARTPRMDGIVQMRISFWAYWLDPLMVAVSKGMCELIRHFPGSYDFGVSARYIFKMSCAHRTLGVHTSLYHLVRYVIPGLEQRFDVSHVYTTLTDWHFLNALGRRAIVLTLTSPSQDADTRLL